MGSMRGSRGNAFHQLRAYAHPHVKHVVTQTLEQEQDYPEDAKDDPVAHLRRQAVRIQRGEGVHQVTALLPSERSRI
jgi:hypothetical protein